MTVDDIKNRSDEVGDCWEWRGSYSTDGVPVLNKKSVRRLGAKAIGKHIPPLFVATTKCNNQRCVCPDHILIVSRTRRIQMNVEDGRYYNPAKTAKMVKTKAKKSRFPDELVEAVRTAQGETRDIADRFNVPITWAYKVRQGICRKAPGNPFFGLMAANDSKRRAA